jgi:hypothetical protein
LGETCVALIDLGQHRLDVKSLRLSLGGFPLGLGRPSGLSGGPLGEPLRLICLSHRSLMGTNSVPVRLLCLALCHPHLMLNLR